MIASHWNSSRSIIPSTVSAEIATQTRWHAVVIGAGPGGAAVAIRLARHNMRVLLVDRDSMPRPKLCGCCLSSMALAELADLQIPPGKLRPVPLNAVCVAAAGGSAWIAMERSACLSRESLDSTLVQQAIDAGAHWLPGVNVSAIDSALGDPRVSALGLSVGILGRFVSQPLPFSGIVLHAECAVVAAGLADHIRIQNGSGSAIPRRFPWPAKRPLERRQTALKSRVGVGTTLATEAMDLESGKLVMAVARGGYCGLVRLEDGRIDLAAAIDRRLLSDSAGPAGAVRRILHEVFDGQPLDGFTLPSDDALTVATYRATPPLTHRSSLVAGDTGRIFRVGDAAGYVEPFTGEGMGWALASSRLCAEAILAHWPPRVHPADPIQVVAAGDRYRRTYKRLFASHHARCLRVARSLRSPRLVAGGLWLTRRVPWIARGVLPLLIGSVAPGHAHPWRRQ
jgi:menaquinone-9 beta-reductase